ncbi:MAG: cytochrome-c oxidase, cbb3-type subunit III [Alphaproteobacteria bacterium]
MADNQHEKEVDQLSGVETTGHEWDGLKELNNPLPKWWLYSFYVTIAWGVAYWILMPAWPLINGHTKGLLGYSQRAKVMEQVQAGKDAQAEQRAALVKVELDEVLRTEHLRDFAMAAGASAFGDNCAACHGQGGGGTIGGYPNLNDDAWLWGGTIDDIYQTINYGIRADHDDTRMGDMLAFGEMGMLARDDITLLTDYLRDVSGVAEMKTHEGVDAKARLVAAKEMYAENCASCHGDDLKGLPEMGAPNLADSIWLYGSDKADIRKSIHAGRAGMMPAWQGRLDDATIRALSIYVYSRGGGQN